MQIVDLTCVVALSPILHTSQSLLNEPCEQRIAAAVDAVFGGTRRLHRLVTPSQVLHDLEDLHQRLTFERDVEGQVQTARWYIEKIVAMSFAAFIRNVVDALPKMTAELFLAPPRTLLTQGRVAEAGVWLQRAIEACSKADRQIHGLAELHKELELYDKTAVRWIPLDSETALAKVSEHRRATVTLLADAVPGLVALAEDETVPDLVGQTRIWLSMEMLAMLEQKDKASIAVFAKLFIAYFNATTSIARALFRAASEPERSTLARAGMDALIDLMDFSGVVYLFSELDGTPFTNVVAATWNDHLASVPDKAPVLRLWLTAIESKLSLPILSSGAAQRFAWVRRFVNALKDRGVEMDRYFSGAKRKVAHRSSVINSLHVHLGHLAHEPHEYFAAVFIAEHAAGAGVDLPPRVEACRRALKLNKGGGDAGS